jgi:NADP-dependent 3-hydroxy acid dehydrogenase YdfG
VNKTIFITGATSGIGKATAILFAQKGFNIIACGRREERLQALQQQLSSITSIHTLCFDVSKNQEVIDAIDSLPNNFKQIDVLLNNAGNAHGLSLIHQGNVEDWDNMIDINVKGLLYVTRALLPNMVVNQSGHIINIGSTAGKEVYKDGNVYCATKHAVDAISKAQRIDLLQYKIKVTAIHPGAVETDFSLIRFKGDAAKAAAVYAGYEPLKAEDIADTAWYVANLPKHVCINDLVMTCVAQGNSFTIHKDA